MDRGQMTITIGRRTFMAALSGAAVAWPATALAQQAGKLPTVGFLGADGSAWVQWTAAFVGRLRELGWIEGRTVAIEYRWSESRPERVAEIAAEFARLKVDVIVAYGGAVTTLKQTQLTETFGWRNAPRYVVRDRDRVYGARFIQRVRAMGIRSGRTTCPL
jgi:hypothetical protein